MNNIEETAIQDEQRLHESIMDEIICVLVKHNMTVKEAERILCYTKDRIKEQKIRVF